ncbi:MAG: hypothetical protein CFH21_00722 [Alphaproteobacteria bacterium MarineAlpha5_Bin11]|nr:YajQ family cyclic di-GMP-binding protein [Pelagibacteraceae bacterium]PPR43632.1 MAG: hypothetical protein CFH21_00722 [Alphaproteobacteria bacterium MarineAlpha5_Bin11]PPR52000.1 MAG: hypothetical protein CFH20_00188 [Alphaproteobacteria bacterium MarineAlpha5_Bin10]|tara:strand:- start:351 stop:836 length:486 start_codon:yes stop_codon:yes gene_type:complete
MPSFDIVSRIDLQEIDNALANCLREIGQRYDFKGSQTSIERNEKEIKIITDDEMKLKQVNDLVLTHLVRRKVQPNVLKKRLAEKGSGNSVRQICDLIEGIEQTISKKITNAVKSSKLKVQAKILGNEIRIDGKKRDDLQAVMTLVDDLRIDQPIQFINLRD